MKKLILLLFILIITTSAWADDYGCFEPNAVVQARLSVLSGNTISGVSSDLRYPDDTQVSTPTMTQINGNAYKTSYTVASSPSQTGKYFLYYYYTDGSTVYSSSNRGPFDSFTVRVDGQCGTTGTASVNVSQINSVATTSVTTVNANIGTTQPINFTGTGATAYPKSDMVDIVGSAVSTSTAQLGVNAVNVGGTAQTGRDLGTSVLLSNGTGAGQISLSSGAVLLQPTQTGVTIPTVTNVGTVTGNVNGSVASVTGAVGSVTGNVGGSVASVASGGITASSIAADAITEAKVSDSLENRLGWVATIDLTGNTDTFVLSCASECVSATNQYIGMKLRCGNESREIVASSSGTPDKITTEPGNPWTTAPTSSTCVIRN